MLILLIITLLTLFFLYVTCKKDENKQIPKISNTSVKQTMEPITKLSKFETKTQKLFNQHNVSSINAIHDRFMSLDEVTEAIKCMNIDNINLIFGIDYTVSNLENGTKTFQGRSLHHIGHDILNPYQKVITIVGKTLESFDEDGIIPAFGFGNETSRDSSIIRLNKQSDNCIGFTEVLEHYNNITPNIDLSGPTNFAPLIYKSIEIVKETKAYHILVIVADGQVTNERQTKQAIEKASYFPLSIVVVGVGDGPWEKMMEFDDNLPNRQFDNFQFVNYHQIIQSIKKHEYDNDEETEKKCDALFALYALMEIPDQYASIKHLKLLEHL
ncbi:hypothetical protein SNEBB_000750 [Seison nebaliae]|nr:hypothetical protein SNEBB_000750 [Seison nebaliae]